MTQTGGTPSQTDLQQHWTPDNALLLTTAACPLDAKEDIFSERYWQQHNAIVGRAAGRGTALFLKSNAGEFVLRQYLRGGLPGKILKDQFLFKGYQHCRAWQEMALLQKMTQLGLPVPEAVAAKIERHGLIYRNQIIIKRIPDAADLHKILCNAGLTPSAWQQVGKAVRDLHDQQVYHHDLNIRNILQDKTGKIWLIDFDKCGFKPGDEWKKDNIARLRRSLLKEKDKQPGLHWDEQNWQQLVAGYQAS